MALCRIGVIGDVHAEHGHLETALHFLQENQVERILCVGDIVDGVGEAARCCELLQQFHVATVRGNHDRWLLQGEMRHLPDATPRQDMDAVSLTFLQALPATQAFETVAGRLLLCHGLGENDMQRLTADDYGYALQVKDELQVLLRTREFRFVICGHTHRRMVRHFDRLTIINPGTLYSAHLPCIATIDFGDSYVQFHDFEDDELIPNCERVELGSL